MSTTAKDVKDIEVKEAEVVGTQSPQIVNFSDLPDEEIERIYQERIKGKEQKSKQLQADFKEQKNKFVVDTANQFQTAHELLLELKKQTIQQATDLYFKMFEMNGKQMKEQNTFSFKSDDGRFKIQVERQERFEFTEEAIVHITTIREIFRQKFQDRNKGFYNLLDGILMKNSKGDYDAKLLTKARRQVNELGDLTLISEFDKLVDCQRVVGSSLYCRAYALDELNKWKDINVQFSSL